MGKLQQKNVKFRDLNLDKYLFNAANPWKSRDMPRFVITRNNHKPLVWFLMSR